MPGVYDNIASDLLSGLRQVMHGAERCSFCVGYFHLRGWACIADLVDHLRECRVLVGMHQPPEEAMEQLQRLRHPELHVDGVQQALLKRRITESFKHQLQFGVPTAAAEQTLRTLARQLRAGSLRIKAFLRHPLHAKLYLVQRSDSMAPLVGFVGSSNLTLPGLSEQGELNVDVLDQDAARKLLRWFDERWNDPLAIDLTDELAKLIEQSWALQQRVRPYLIYLTVAYHLSEAAREGAKKFRLPRELENVLLDFQANAVYLAAQLLHKHDGVLLGDVVGLGKTLMATAVAKIFQEDADANTLVICPPKLVDMWEDYLQRYRILGRVLSIGKVVEELGRLDAPRYRLVIIDESHNLRNREGKRYRTLRNYIHSNDCRVMLLSATPYNKHYADLSNQLRLFLDDDAELHVRPERYLRQWYKQGKTDRDFVAQYKCSPSSLRAFEKSSYPDDWRDLMRLFLVRRTRSFILRNYAQYDHVRQRYYVQLPNGQRRYFPIRQPRTLAFSIDPSNPNDQYAHLLTDEVVETIETLQLPRYGLANYLHPDAERIATEEQQQILADLNRAGRRLIGFCRTNLFKRLESSGNSFLLSVERHILRNLVTLHALDRDLPIPIGTQDAAAFDTALTDTDDLPTLDADEAVEEPSATELETLRLDALRTKAAELYKYYRSQRHDRFKWLEPRFFTSALRSDLDSDVAALSAIIERVGKWNPATDAKLNELWQLLTEKHREDKVLIFTQFADTAQYLHRQLRQRGLQDVEVVTTATGNPTAVARRFSPSSNGGLRNGETELRVLIATDVLAEGQNLQDAHIVVNYDLPWAIIRLIQRAGRVDRIGQQHDTITVYSFLPADGVERIIRLRQRLIERLNANQEVLGTDESFFGEDAAAKLRDLYTEKANVLDDDSSDEDIDVASLALQAWNSASESDRRAALQLPPIVYTARAARADQTPGIITYLRFPDGSDALVRVDSEGKLVSQSLTDIFRALECPPDEPAVEPATNHHALVRCCIEATLADAAATVGALGTRHNIQRRLYERLQRIRQQRHLFDKLDPRKLDSALEQLLRYQLSSSAREKLSRQMRLGINDADLAELVVTLAESGQLCTITEQTAEHQEPQVICSLGIQPQALR